jgi:hypothetical protein
MTVARNGQPSQGSRARKVRYAVRRLAATSLLMLSSIAGCSPNSMLIRPGPKDPVIAGAVERLPPVEEGPPRKKTFRDRIFPSEEERRAHANESDDIHHWNELGGG